MSERGLKRLEFPLKTGMSVTADLSVLSAGAQERFWSPYLKVLPNSWVFLMKMNNPDGSVGPQLFRTCLAMPGTGHALSLDMLHYCGIAMANCKLHTSTCINKHRNYIQVEDFQPAMLWVFPDLAQLWPPGTIWTRVVGIAQSWFSKFGRKTPNLVVPISKIRWWLGG